MTTLETFIARPRPRFGIYALVAAVMALWHAGPAAAAPDEPVSPSKTAVAPKSVAPPASVAVSDHEQLLELQRQIGELKARVFAQEKAPAAPTAPAAPAAQSVPPSPPKPQRLDEAEPPFGEFDFSWLNGNNNQPASLLTVGPLTWSLYIDAYYAYQFHAPIDHTIFPTTTAARHNEISFNLGILGVELTGLDGPIGRLFIQYGTNIETDAGQDPTVTRGYFLTAAAFKYIQQAAAGWHFHALHGINLEMGIFSSYVGLESYLPQENWSYTHAFLADATPYYFFGIRGQIFVTQRLKVELWLVNGWQTFGQWQEAKAGGYLINWRPREWLSLVNSFYVGQEVQGDPDSLRPYTDNNIQIRYYKGESSRVVRSAAFSLTADIGYDRRGAPGLSGVVGGASLAHRLVFRKWLATTARADFFYDEHGALVQQLPLGNPYHLPNTGAYLLAGVSATLDVAPSPWFLLRLEYAHRISNQPYFSGHGGITGPMGIQTPIAAPGFAPDLVTSDDRVILNVTLRL